MRGKLCMSVCHSIPENQFRFLCPLKELWLAGCQDLVLQQSERKRTKGHRQPHKPPTIVRTFQNLSFKNYLFFPLSSHPSVDQTIYVHEKKLQTHFIHPPNSMFSLFRNLKLNRLSGRLPKLRGFPFLNTM